MIKIQNNRQIASNEIAKEILIIEELILACLLKNKECVNINNVSNILSYMSNSSIFLQSIFTKMFYLHQINLHCNYEFNTDLFDKEELSTLIKINIYQTLDLNIEQILNRHRKLSYLLLLEDKLLKFNKQILNNNVLESEINDFVSDITDTFSNKFKSLDNRIIHQSNLYDFIGDLFFNDDVNTVTTGYSDLDRTIGGGMRLGDIIIIAAKPGNAKTMMCLNIINNNISNLNDSDKKVLYFCPDMHIRYIYRRMWSIYTGNSQSDILNVSKQDMYKDIKNIPIITSEACSLDEIIRIIRYYKNKIKIVIIDYIQLITCSKNTFTRNEQIATVVSELKRVIREANILLILISQVNRESEKSKIELSISHLNDSGSLEQDSDIIFLLSNNSNTTNKYYNKDGDLFINLVIGKNRHGSQNTNFYFNMSKKNFRIRNVKKEEKFN